MKTLKKTLFTCAMIIGLAVTMSAQKNNDQKKPPTPPKPPPPVINPGEGKKPRPTPKREDSDKKPKDREYSMVIRKEIVTS